MIFYITLLLSIILILESIIFFHFTGYLPLICLVAAPIGYIISITLYGKFGDKNKGILGIFKTLKNYYKNRRLIPIMVLIISAAIILLEPYLYFSINKETPQFLVEIVKNDKGVPDIEIVLQELREWPTNGIKLKKTTNDEGRAFFNIDSPGFWQIGLIEEGKDSIAKCLLKAFVIERFPYMKSFDLDKIPSDNWEVKRKTTGLKPDFDFSTKNIYAYPVPFRAKEGHKIITFTNLPPNSNISILSISGSVIKSINNIGPGDWIWDVKNDSGIDIVSGVYLYNVQTRNSVYNGKLMIIR